MRRRIFVLAIVSTAAVLGSSAPAGAELVAPASGLAMDSAWPVAAGPGGRALAIVPGPFCEGCNDGRVAERAPSGRWALRAITPPGMFPVFVGWGPGAAATALGVANVSAGTGGADAFVLRRPAGAERFAAPVPIALGGPIWERSSTSSDARGDIALLTGVKGPDSDVPRPVVVMAAGGGSFGAPQALGPRFVPEEAAVAVGAGRVLVAYRPRRGVYVRSGRVGSPLGPPQLLSSRGFGRVSVAVDDAGNATVAFVRGQMRQELLVARARSGGRFGPPVVVARSLGTFYPLAATAGGTTTALVWQTPFSGEDERVHVVIARGAGHFTTPATPSAPALQPNLGYAPHDPAVAVDRAGDVLLAYTYSYGGAVHATLRPAGSSRFGPLHVISKLGEGGTPSVALLSDRRPLVIYHGRRRELLATTRLTGPSPDLTPPRVDIRFPPDARNELRRTNAVTVTVRCSQPCMLQTRASLHSHDGTTRADGVQRKLLRPGVTFTERFTFDPDRRAGRSRSGARVRVTIEAQNASGAARQAVKQLKL